jgi:aminoglycoside phosphotransferase (APT) family kinase protein
MGNDREDFDNLVWDRNDEAWAESQKQLRYKTTCRLAESLVEKKFGRKPATLVSPLIIGGYNILYRIRLEGTSPDVILRLPCPSLAQFPAEKTLREAATARYIEQNTRIPVPRVFHHGQHSDLGPFIILQYVENKDTLSDALTINKDDFDEPHVLNPNVSDATLETHYFKVAHCLLQLIQPTFPRIGSLVESEDGSSYSVAGRPITLNMNNMLQLANIPASVLPSESKTYETADDWYLALAEMHIAQLVFQHNDLVSTKDDCRNKYVARQLFRRLAKQGRLSTFGFAEDNWSAQSKAEPRILSSAPAQSGSFRLWCDDFRAGNILLNESDDIVGIIDWEFAYVGPTQFVLDPPWWLLIEVPEMWSSGIEDWAKIYDMRLKIWLLVMKKAEESTGLVSLPFELSVCMKESWDTGRFWLNYAARKSWAFDTIFWKYIDERFFGEREGHISKDDLWKTRVHLLSEEERRAMEPFVETKMEKSKERIIVDWDPKEAKEHLAEVLFD